MYCYGIRFFSIQRNCQSKCKIKYFDGGISKVMFMLLVNFILHIILNKKYSEKSYIVIFIVIKKVIMKVDTFYAYPNHLLFIQYLHNLNGNLGL